MSLHQASFGAESAFSSPVEIPVAFHIIRADNGTTGNVTNAQVTSQIATLNQFFGHLNINFILNSINRHNSTDYHYHDIDTEELSLKSTYNTGTSHKLNVYVVDIANGVGGYATFPNQYDENSYIHGVVLHYTLFSGSPYPNNLGRVLIHEVGHYLGLYHTFQGGRSDHDQCADTPAYLMNTGKPPANTDTCISKPGYDPVHNHMNYTLDEWRYEFTHDQNERMVALTSLYKSNLLIDYLWKIYPLNIDNYRNTDFGGLTDYAYPWVWHFEHGWMYTISESIDSVWFFAGDDLGWLWTNASDYPYLWRASDEAWLFYFTGYSTPRQFFNFESNSFEYYYPNSEFGF